MPITVSSDAVSNADLEEEVDQDINAFDKFFTSVQKPDAAQPLSGFERAAIKTYLGWKLDVQSGGQPKKG